MKLLRVALTNERGQFILEAILIMIIFVGVMLLVAAQFKKNQILSQLVTGPWTNLSGMLENGVWSTPANGQPNHPSQHGRHVTIDGLSPYGGG